ncbi:MAG: hypothetical protein IT332_11705 [Ardenticatenales bacterium]|nr:hypothetical protein [Ardenticatenales bacterium]
MTRALRDRAAEGRGWRAILVTAALAALALANAVGVRGASGFLAGHRGVVDAYTIEIDDGELANLNLGRYGVLDIRRQGDRIHVALGLTLFERDELLAAGFEPVLWRNDAGQTAAGMFSAYQDQQGYKVYRSWDQPGGIKDELDALAAAHPDIVEKVVIGHSVQGRELVALRVTKGGAAVPQGSRTAVWFNSLQHAREWIAIETNRRLMRYFIEQYGKDPTVTSILDGTEVWFVVAANPDGYQQTFTEGNRLWRRNMRDNNGDGQYGQGDGVDMNRNFGGHWNYDNDGSSGNPNSDTYRGTGPASEPEVVAAQDLMKRIPFRIILNYHSAAELLLFPDGWQDLTPTADDPIYRALTGTRANPAVPGFDPILSSGLYITNGETCDYAHAVTNALCITPELSTPPGGGTFEFPDDEALIQAEFEKNLPFALDVARTALDPTNVVSHLGNTAAPISVDAFATSYGDPQPVQATVQRRLGDATMRFRINDGAPQAVTAAEWDGGERYGATGDVYYRRVRGTVSGAAPGDKVTVWFEAGGEQTESFTYTLERDSDRPVLVVAAEDYTGGDPVYPATDGPRHLAAYTDALTRIDVAFDVYDFDAHARTSPSFLGVLGHYEGVVWYTGDDRAMHPADWPDGESSAAQRDMMLAMRDFMNEGGKVVYLGPYAARPFLTNQRYNAFQPDQPCGQQNPNCEALQNDFAQYWLGIDGGGFVEPAAGGRVIADVAPFAGLTIDLNDSLTVNGVTDFDLTSARHPPAEYPQFAALSAGSYAGVGLGPHGGEKMAFSGLPQDEDGNARDYEWQRVQRTIDLTGKSTAELSFFEAHQLRANFEALIVEAHTVGLDDWTTLPDTGGRTSERTALACNSAAWWGLFPHLPHYMKRVGEGNMATCEPQGTTGRWNAIGGTSNRWLPFTADLSAWSGKQVEVAITYVRSRRQQGNTYIALDDIVVTADGQAMSTATFEDGDGGWAFTGLPAGGNWAPTPPAQPEPPSDPSVQFVVAGREALPLDVDGAIVVGGMSITFGFGLEMVKDEAMRADLVKRSLAHLGIGFDVPPGATPTSTMPPATPDTRSGAIYLPLAVRGMLGELTPPTR